MANVEAGLPEREAPLVDLAFRLRLIVVLLLGGLILRLPLAFLPGFGVDIGTFTAWADRLATDGPWNFYGDAFFTDYAPGYMYVLWFIGELNQSFNFSPGVYEYVLKVPAIVADLASAYLLYRLLEDVRPQIRYGAVGLYLVFPASLLIGPIWGQVDSVLAFFVLLSIYYISRERPLAGAVAFTVGFLMKPQAIAALPFLAFWIMRQHPPEWKQMAEGIRLPVPPRVWVQCVVVPMAVLLVLITPFFTYKPWELISQLYDATNVENYRVNSFWAYNFWTVFGLFDGGFRPDSETFLGVQTRIWGFGMFGASLASVLYFMRRSRGTGALALGTALCMLAFYMFLTRMHERYVFAFFLPFLAACALIHSRALWASFFALGAVHFLNLYHVYVYYYPNELRVEGIYRWFERSNFLGTGLETVQVLSLIMFTSFPLLVLISYALSSRRPAAHEPT